MNQRDDSDLKLAVLIDADNVPYSNVKGMMEEIAIYGTPTTKRIYADWTRPNANGWKGVLLEHAITPIQQYSYTSGKNSSESALIIDAMDLLYTRRFDGFCLISSDSDFTGLALRIREEGLMVLGFGEQKTPEAFRNACHKFIFTEVLRQSDAQKQEAIINIGETTKIKQTDEVIQLQQKNLKRGDSSFKDYPEDLILKALETS